MKKSPKNWVINISGLYEKEVAGGRNPWLTMYHFIACWYWDSLWKFVGVVLKSNSFQIVGKWLLQDDRNQHRWKEYDHTSWVFLKEKHAGLQDCKDWINLVIFTNSHIGPLKSWMYEFRFFAAASYLSYNRLNFIFSWKTISHYPNFH